jgi:hypothetical protein
MALVTNHRAVSGHFRTSLPTTLKGRRPTWGPRLPAPHHHLYWPVGWQQSRAWVYGQVRSFQYKQLRCRWAVSGAQIPMHVLVVQMAGYAEPWFLVTSALELSAARVVAVWAARFRQEDGFRDHKQRLDQGADPAHLSGATGSPDPAALAGRPPGSGLGGRELLGQACVESAEAPCRDPGSSPRALAIPPRVFAVLGRLGEVGKNPATPGPGPKLDRKGCLKS